MPCRVQIFGKKQRLWCTFTLSDRLQINDKSINNEVLNIAHTDAEKFDKYVINYLKFNSKVSFEKSGCIANKSFIDSAYTVCSVPK